MSRWNALKKTYRMCTRLRAQRGGSRMAYLLDALRCSVRHGASPENYFVLRYHVIALKPQYSSWGIGFRKLTEAEWNAAPDRQALFDELCAGKYLAEEFVQSDDSLARFHPASLNTLRVITFRRGDRFEVFGAGLRVGNNGPQWEEICDFCRSAAQTLPCLRVVGWDVAILPGGKLELIEGNHNPGMNIVQAPAKHGVHDKFAHMLLDFYGDPAQYACETVKQP